jgi:hypothetical protein
MDTCIHRPCKVQTSKQGKNKEKTRLQCAPIGTAYIILLAHFMPSTSYEGKKTKCKANSESPPPARKFACPDRRQRKRE